MGKRAIQLQFTEEELSDHVVKKAAKKAATKVKKLEKAEAKIPKKALSFEESQKPVSKLTHAAKDMPVNVASANAHRAVQETEQDNVGVESAHRAEEAAEGGVRVAQSSRRSQKLRPYRNAARAEAKADRANLKALNKQADRFGPAHSRSHHQQKKAIQREYAAVKRAGRAGASTQSVAASSITQRAAEQTASTGRRAMEFIRRHKKGFAILLAAALIAALLLNTLSSCSVLMEGAVSAIGMSTYPSSDEDMLAAEAAYAGMEAELQSYLDNYESTHDYDEYHFDLEDIEHDPYVLISMLTALHGGAWTIDEVQSDLQMLFDKQYILTEDVTTETRYRTETTTEIGEDGEEVEVETQVPYDYTICTVTLDNFNLSHVPIYVMSEDQLSMYAMYMGTLGNRPDLFADSAYVSKYRGEYDTYEIPPEALSDQRFANMMAEATKYIGYPYVWGGSSPSTSFDCSGFVSWVINNCGNGWNVGRLGADSLYYICTPVSAANAKPGDLVFFERTYDETGITHVGIYVGNNTMLHCGDPIQYADLSGSYWQSHLYGYGRIR